MQIGVLGGGQLGKMLGTASIKLGHKLRFLDPASDSVASSVGELLTGDYVSTELLEKFISGVNLVTYEVEHIPIEAVGWIAKKLEVLPPIKAIEVGQDRLFEKETFKQLGIPSAPYCKVNSKEELIAGIKTLGLPAILKTRTAGYDGKGQFFIKTEKDIADAWTTLGAWPLLLEGFVKFERELSIIAVRGKDGSTKFYPLCENHHRDGILRVTYAPAPKLSETITEQAQKIATKLLDHFNYVGVLTVELFQHNGALIANEIAPRVHNSGHWTIEGAATSQFENHLRAISGMPLGDTLPSGYAAMLNIIGELPDKKKLEELSKLPNTFVHLYGKAPRAGRKLGHITFVRESQAELQGISLVA